MNNVESTSSIASVENKPIKYREDDFSAEAFLLKSAFILALFLGFAFLFLKWLSKKIPSIRRSVSFDPSVSKINIIEFKKASIRTSIFLVEIDGNKAVITETIHGSRLTWLPKEVTQA